MENRGLIGYHCESSGAGLDMNGFGNHVGRLDLMIMPRSMKLHQHKSHHSSNNQTSNQHNNNNNNQGHGQRTQARSSIRSVKLNEDLVGESGVIKEDVKMKQLFPHAPPVHFADLQQS